MIAPVRYEAGGAYRVALDQALGHPDSVRGSQRDYKCPKCKVSHLHVDLRKGKALCHKCGLAFGSIPKLLRSLGVDVKIKAFEPDVLSDYLIDLFYGTKEKETYEVELPDGCKPLPIRPTERLPRVIYRYLRGRGLTSRMIRQLEIGYVEKGKMRGYAIFPVQVGKRRVTWTSRNICGLGPKVRHAVGGLARHAVFNHGPSQGCKRLFLVEGPFDALAMHKRLCETDGCVALLGTEMPSDKAHIIANMRPRSVYVLLDADAYDKALMMADKLSAVIDCPIYVVKLLDERDPDELSTEEIAARVKKAKLYDDFTYKMTGKL